MRMTKFSDYALRTLIYAAGAEGRLVTVEETADAFGISRAHLKKVVLILVRGGFLTATRGRTGGFTLARAPEEINLGDVLKATEPDFEIFECFGPGNRCVITDVCRLSRVADRALRAFAGVFEAVTLRDVLVSGDVFARIAGQGPGAHSAPRVRPRPPWT